VRTLEADRTVLHALCLMLILSCSALSPPAQADTATISSAGIMSAALDLSCQAYQVIGLCLWMTCTPVGCEFDYSVRAEHYIPEVVVSAYPFIGNTSWPEANHLASPTSFAEEGGASDEGGAIDREQALKFKHADVIGSPGVIDYWALAAVSSDVLPFCTPQTWPMTPYFVSTFDPAWRNPVVETPLALANVLQRVGRGAATFAGLYPRIGFTHQSHDYKSALVAAIRAMDIVSQDYQPHVYLPLDSFSTPAQGQWPPSGTGGALYQQLTPSIQSCRVLPDIDDTLYPLDPYAGRLNQVRGNAWQVWRPYRCCEPAGAVLILTL
jgi:integrating conjugative element protein (TIGR03756 family)